MTKRPRTGVKEEFQIDSYSERIYPIYQENYYDILHTSNSINITEENQWQYITNCMEWATQTIDFDIQSQKTGPQLPTNLNEPIEYFSLFFTDELMNIIIKETNDYAKEQIKNKDLSRKSTWHKWNDVTKQEFQAFISVILNMGLIRMSTIQDYWSTDPTSDIPFFRETFTRDRFQQIFWMLDINRQTENDDSIKSRIEKTSFYLEYIDTKFNQYFIPEKEICVIESVIKSDCSISFIQCNDTKPNKYEIRMYALADSKTGYLFSILPYFGDVTVNGQCRSDLPFPNKIPLELYEKLLKKVPSAKGYNLYTGRYFTSIPLVKELFKRNCHLTGTIDVNQNGIPTKIQKPDFSINKMVACRKQDMTLLSWKDKGIVTILSNNNVHNKTCICTHFDKPQVILDFLNNMKCADRLEQYVSSYCFMGRSLKWWRKLFFWALEMCGINSYIIYQCSEQINQRKPISHLNFMRKLITQLRGDFRSQSNHYLLSSPNNSTKRYNPLHIPNKGPRSRDCAVCSDRKNGVRRQTNYYCETCPKQPAMHIKDCFKIHHEKK